MKFVMLHAVDESTFANTEECGAPEALAAWVEEMTARGIVLDGARLCPTSDATTVRADGGRTIVHDGPFAETKEQIAGYDVIECTDLDEALAVAAAHPTTNVGSIEVRAFAPGLAAPDVDDEVPAGRQRYLMLVCADTTGAASERSKEAVPVAAGGDAAESDADPETDAHPETDPDAPAEIDVWVEDTDGRGVRLYGWALEDPASAVTVRRVHGSAVTVDGPFAETKEQICGFDLLQCRDLDEAIAVAAAHPVADGGVLELRPLWS